MFSICFLECPEGFFGQGCRHRCQCENKAACEHVSGACTCLSGWIGTYCEKRRRGEGLKLVMWYNITKTSPFNIFKLIYVSLSACPEGFHGFECQQKCQCLNGGRCHPVTGDCQCPSGRVGPLCNTSESFYCAQHPMTINGNKTHVQSIPFVFHVR